MQICVVPFGRSSEWGVMPPHWYFTATLPQALGAALPLAMLGAMLERRVRPALAIALAYVAVYSYLPHKEVSSSCVATLQCRNDGSCYGSCRQSRDVS